MKLGKCKYCGKSRRAENLTGGGLCVRNVSDCIWRLAEWEAREAAEQATKEKLAELEAILEGTYGRCRPMPLARASLTTQVTLLLHNMPILKAISIAQMYAHKSDWDENRAAALESIMDHSPENEDLELIHRALIGQLDVRAILHPEPLPETDLVETLKSILRLVDLSALLRANGHKQAAWMLEDALTAYAHASTE